MIHTIDSAATGVAPSPRVAPVHLGATGNMLLTGDVIAGLLVIAVAHLLGAGAPAFLAVAATLLVALATRRYRLSFAVTPREEWYAAGGDAILGGIVGLFFSLALGFMWFAAIAGAAAWWLLASIAASWVHAHHRGAGPYITSLHHVREAALGSRWRLEQHLTRLLDVIFGIVAFGVLWPVMLVVAILIASDDGAPVFFGQERATRDDRTFTMWKFRTMRRDADARWASPDDDRITKVGRRLRSTSLDELPQLLNVLAGSMSLVGPRPEMREYAEGFAHRYLHYSQRHIVRPGLTGWAQVRLPRNFQPDEIGEVLEHDLFYVQYASVQLYMFCLVKTACEIFSHKAV